MKKLLCLLFLFVSNTIAFADQAIIADQPTAPLKILEASYTRTTDPQTQVTRLSNFTCKLQNISGRRIRSWGLVWSYISISGITKDFGIRATEAPLPTPISKWVEPGEIITDVFNAQSQPGAGGQITVRLDFADDGAGLLWNPTHSPKYQVILTQRSARDAECQRVVDLLISGGIGAVQSDLQQRIQGMDPNTQDSALKALFYYRKILLGISNREGILGLQRVLGMR